MMASLYQREYSDGCFGEICRKALGLYAWSFSFPNSKEPFVKGISLSFWNAMGRVNKYHSLYGVTELKEWSIT